MPDTFTFKCMVCQQPINGEYAMEKKVIQCPSCNERLKVPRGSYVVKISPEVDDVEWGFGDEHLEAFAAEDPRIADVLASATMKNCWEFMVVSLMLESRLRQVTQMLADGAGKPRPFKGWIKVHAGFTNFIDQSTVQYLDLLNDCYALMSTYMQDALYGESLETIILFGTRCQECIEGMMTFHQGLPQHSLPADAPYAQIEHILYNLVPNLDFAMSQAVMDLADTYAKGTLAAKAPEFSLISPDIHMLFNMRAKLPKKIDISKGKPKKST